MSTVLDVLRASGGTDVEILTIELKCSAWPSSIFMCNGFFDQTFMLESGTSQVFQALAFDVARPRRSNNVSEVLIAAIDNVRNEAEPLIDIAKETGARIDMVLRSYLESNPSEPAENPISFEVMKATFEDSTLNISAGNPDLVNISWPRDRYTLDFAPGITYIA